MGLWGFVGGFSATVAFGRAMVEAAPPVEGVFAVLSAMVGAPTPGRGVLAVFSAIVGAPTGVLLVASLMVGAPTVGGPTVGGPARRGTVADAAGGVGAVGAPTDGWAA